MKKKLPSQSKKLPSQSKSNKNQKEKDIRKYETLDTRAPISVQF